MPEVYTGIFNLFWRNEYLTSDMYSQVINAVTLHWAKYINKKLGFEVRSIKKGSLNWRRGDINYIYI